MKVYLEWLGKQDVSQEGNTYTVEAALDESMNPIKKALDFEDGQSH